MGKDALVPCTFIVLTLSMLAAGGAEIVVARNGCEVTFPDSWTVDKHPDANDAGGQLIIHAMNVVSSLGDNSSFKVHLIDHAAKDNDLRGFVDHQLINHYQLNNSKLVERAKTKLGDVDAYKVTIGPPQADKLVVYFILRGDKGYEIVVKPARDIDEKTAKEIDAIVKSFKLIEAK